MNYLVTQAGLTEAIVCDSAGTSSYHIGSPPDSRMRAAASARGIQLRGRARQFLVSDLEKFDLILAMDRENYRHLVYTDRQGKYRDKIKLMCEFASEHDHEEVPDPYYGGADGFNQVIDLLLDSCGGLLNSLIESKKVTSKQ